MNTFLEVYTKNVISELKYSDTSKILTKLILGRIEKKTDENLEDQFRFRKNRGTRETILCLRSIVKFYSKQVGILLL